MRKLLIISILANFFISCSLQNSNNACPEEKLEGSLNMNSIHNEIMPYYYDGSLMFMQEYTDIKGNFELLKLDNVFDPSSFPQDTKSFKFKGLLLTSPPSFFYNPETGFTEAYFSAVNLKLREPNEDIFFIYGRDGNYSDPVEIPNLNTEFNESSPSVNSTGDMIVFVSDRNKETGKDIYISNNLNEGWNLAQKLGPEINTEFDEQSPKFSPENHIYFSSNGYTELDNFDIIKSVSTEKGWDYGKLLPYPFNTEFDEEGVALGDSEIFVSSNREGGCGEFDIFNFSRCQTGRLNISIYSKDPNYRAVGKIELYKENDLIQVLQIDEKGLSLDLEPGKYYFEFTSKCLSDGLISDHFKIKCDEEFISEHNIDVAIPKPQIGNFSFEEYNIPFFVSGYYMPNTSENLENLKLKFKFNQMDSDSTSFVEDPKDKYDESSKEVDKALNQALSFLLNKVNNLSSECSNSEEIVKVQVVGFADPRPLANNSKYFGPTINDEHFNFKIDNGVELDNKLLSKLRAYYTAKYFEEELKRNPNYSDVSFRFIWEIRGLGVDPYKGTTYDYNRRVKISVESLLN